MTNPDPDTTRDADDQVEAQDVLSTPAGEEPTPEESALAQPQYPTS